MRRVHGKHREPDGHRADASSGTISSSSLVGPVNDLLARGSFLDPDLPTAVFQGKAHTVTRKGTYFGDHVQCVMDLEAP